MIRMLTLLAVLSRNGWTGAMAVNLLGEPDERTETGSPLYRLDRVLATERTWEFTDARAMARIRAAKFRAGQLA